MLKDLAKAFLAYELNNPSDEPVETKSETVKEGTETVDQKSATKTTRSKPPKPKER